MKTITPITIWNNGAEVKVSVLDVTAMTVKLGSSAEFIYHLYSINETGKLDNFANQGRLTMDGQDYQNWDQDSFAWDWVANKLKLNIIGEYIPPVSTNPDPFVHS